MLYPANGWTKADELGLEEDVQEVVEGDEDVQIIDEVRMMPRPLILMYPLSLMLRILLMYL